MTGVTLADTTSVKSEPFPGFGPRFGIAHQGPPTEQSARLDKFRIWNLRILNFHIRSFRMSKPGLGRVLGGKAFPHTSASAGDQDPVAPGGLGTCP